MLIDRRLGKRYTHRNAMDDASALFAKSMPEFGHVLLRPPRRLQPADLLSCPFTIEVRNTCLALAPIRLQIAETWFASKLWPGLWRQTDVWIGPNDVRAELESKDHISEIPRYRWMPRYRSRIPKEGSGETVHYCRRKSRVDSKAGPRCSVAYEALVCETMQLVPSLKRGLQRKTWLSRLPISFTHKSLCNVSL